MKVKLIKTGYDFQNRLALGRWGNCNEVISLKENQIGNIFYKRK